MPCIFIYIKNYIYSFFANYTPPTYLFISEFVFISSYLVWHSFMHTSYLLVMRLFIYPFYIQLYVFLSTNYASDHTYLFINKLATFTSFSYIYLYIYWLYTCHLLIMHNSLYAYFRSNYTYLSIYYQLNMSLTSTSYAYFYVYLLYTFFIYLLCIQFYVPVNLPVVHSVMYISLFICCICL